MPRRGPSKETKERAPAARVGGRKGKTNRQLQLLSDMFKARSEGQATRWVYSPTHKPELSNVVSRQVDGYRIVRNDELGEDYVASLPGLKPDEPVRVGDVILMCIEAHKQKEFQDELDARAMEDMQRVEEEFRQNIEDMAVPNMREEHRARPRGRSHMEEVEAEVEGDEKYIEKE